MIGQSKIKTCGEQRRTIENPKWLGDSAECAGTRGD
jgi:hypothetical protein